jgi:uncharacterized protein (DUF1501 family)
LLTRRQFLRTGATASVAALAAPHVQAWLPSGPPSDTQARNRDVIVSIFLRGGADGLTLCVPFGDASYYASRSTIAIPRPDASSPRRATALNDFFAIPQAMTPLLPAYRAKDLLIVHAAGQLDDSRSHFEAQRYMEVGKAADPDVVTGWLGRHLASVPPMRAGATLRGIGLSPGLRKMLVGAPKTLPVNPASADIGGSADTLAERMAFLKAVYAEEPEPVRTTALDSLAASAFLTSLDIKSYVPANRAVYPDNAFAAGLRSVAALIKADVGIEAAQLDLNGWDTHASQDPLAGSMFETMTIFAKALAAFHADVIAPGDRRVTVVAMSEFGRNVVENGSGGTDHGRATVMFVMGRGIAGGRVLVNVWPGLAKENLESGQDLKVTLDYRDVLAEIVTKRLANDNLSLVFPGLTPTVWGVTR